MSYSPKTALAVAAIAAVFAGQAATAASVNFLDGNGANVSEAVYEIGGVTLTITAGTLHYSSKEITTGNREIDLSANGLGVDDISGDGENTDANYFDGKGGNDTLIFTFSEEVELNSINFYGVDDNDRAAVGSVSDGIFAHGPNWARLFDTMTDDGLATVSGDALTAVEAQRTGFSFGVSAIRDYHNFRITGLDFTAIGTPLPNILSASSTAVGSAASVSAVPLPGSGLMLLGAMGAGAAFVKRRKQRG